MSNPTWRRNFNRLKRTIQQESRHLSFFSPHGKQPIFQQLIVWYLEHHPRIVNEFNPPDTDTKEIVQTFDCLLESLLKESATNSKQNYSLNPIIQKRLYSKLQLDIALYGNAYNHAMIPCWSTRGGSSSSYAFGCTDAYEILDSHQSISFYANPPFDQANMCSDMLKLRDKLMLRHENGYKDKGIICSISSKISKKSSKSQNPK